MLTPPLDEGQHKINEAFAQSLQKKVHAVGPARLVQPAGPSPFEIAETISVLQRQRMLHTILGIVCYMRRPHVVCGIRISYVRAAYWMRHPHTILGDRILYTAPAYHMWLPHIVCGSPIYFPEPHVKMWNPQRSCGCQRNSNVTVVFRIVHYSKQQSNQKQNGPAASAAAAPRHRRWVYQGSDIS